jgi:hypothetical protein
MYETLTRIRFDFFLGLNRRGQGGDGNLWGCGPRRPQGLWRLDNREKAKTETNHDAGQSKEKRAGVFHLMISTSFIRIRSFNSRWVLGLKDARRH